MRPIPGNFAQSLGKEFRDHTCFFLLYKPQIARADPEFQSPMVEPKLMKKGR